MKNTLLNISGKLNKSFADVIYEVQEASDSLSIGMLLIGALARDIHFEYARGFKNARATLDVDVAVLVDKLNDYDSLKIYLVSHCGFKKTRIAHRLEKDKIEVDLIPFGGNAFPLKRIVLDDSGSEMNISAFEDVYDASVEVILSDNPKLQVRVPNVAGLMVLKLFSYSDNPDRRKDAEDIYFIMKYFENTLEPEIIHEQYEHLLAKFKYDSTKISIAVLGEQIKAFLKEDALNILKHIIYEEIKERSDYSLILKMRRHEDNSFEQTLELMTILYESIK